MAATPVHSKIITNAARKILRPMGLVQQGRSRVWLDDHVWWMCMVEFQPSGWSRGSYLNVGCTWLWTLRSVAGFRVGYRVADVAFIEFESEEQFEPLAEQLVRRAADEIAKYRDMFPDTSSVAKYYMQRSPRVVELVDAAIACAIAGYDEAAHTYFRTFIEYPPGPHDNLQAWQADAEGLDRLVGDRPLFTSTIVERVRQTRRLQKLPEVDINLD